MAENEKATGEKPAGTGKPQEQRTQTWLELMKVVAMPLVALVVGFVFNFSLNQRQQRDADNRMYIDMMGRREDSESALRKDMFKSILDTFMRQDQNTKITPGEQLGREVLSVELLAYNFHESMDIAPLFQHVRQRIPDNKLQENLRSRLERVAVEVCERQISALSEGTAVARADADFAELQNDRVPHLFWNKYAVAAKDAKAASRVCLSMSRADGIKYYRQFLLEVIGYDKRAREILVRLVATRPVSVSECENAGLDLAGYREFDINFSVGSFDFPMIDNTRLSSDERCAVAVTDLTDYSTKLALLYFPGTRASFKDKRFFDDMLKEMRRKMVSSDTDKP